MKKGIKQILSAVVAVIMLLSSMPFSAFAAPASDLPDNMVDSPILRALEYTGYDVQKQKDDGTLYQSGSYGSRAPEEVRSNIGYSTTLSGMETVEDSSTKTGLAPDIEKFEEYGLCCAGFVTYYLCNYLPNIEGADTQFITDAVKETGLHPQGVVTWQRALNNLADEGVIEKIGTSASNVDRDKLAPGDVIIFGNNESSRVHIAVYSGTYKGDDFIIHVGNDRGPEILPVDWMGQSGDKSSYPNAYFHFPESMIQNEGTIEVYKKDTDGKSLSGAVFVATSTTDSSKQYIIGPTDNSGYAFTEGVPYDTYKIKETVFPESYRAYGTSEWTVTINSDTPNATVTVNAVNELIPGSCQIIKTSEDGVVDGIKFTISGNGVNKTVTTAKGSKITVSDLKPGTYTVTEESMDKYEPQEPRSVTVVSGQTATVTFNNSLKRGELKVIKTAEDGFVEGVRFKLSGVSLSGEKVELYAVTDSDGIAIFKDVPITGENQYKLEEVGTQSFYITPASQSVTIEWNKVTEKYFYNELKRSDIKVIKTAEDGFVEGVKFKLSGTSLNGEKVELFAITDKNGIALFKNVPVSGTLAYVLEEVDTAERYIIPNSQSAVIEWNTVTEKSFHNELKRGDLKVVKTSEDNFVEGIRFRLSGTSLSGHKVELYATTDADGVAMFKDVLISGDTPYMLEEVNTSERYIVPQSQKVAIEWNKVISVSVHNELKRGDLRVKKNSEDGLAEGVRFHLYGTSLSGIKVDEYATTDSDGIATFKDILIGSGYTLEEVNTATRYVVPNKQEAVIEWDKVTDHTFNNILKKFRVEVFKVDSDLDDTADMYGKTQGDATLEGAVYGLYQDGKLLETYTTDKNGYFITDYYVCGEGYCLKEISPSTGYLLDPTEYSINCSAEKYTVELYTEHISVFEDIIKGRINIIKHADDGSTQIETPEVGAVFEVYLKSAGSYENAQKTERAILVTDKYGFAETGLLPYGTYVCEQISGLDGTALMPAFDVNINADGETYRYLINNSTFMSDIVIRKEDAETGKIIPAAGVGFKVRNTDTGEYVVQHINYPTRMDIEIYYTTEDGTLMLPYALPFGNYEIIEQCTAYGYVLDETPVVFKVDGSAVVLTVTKSNVPQKGTITITKSGEVFSSVTETDGMYHPVYAVSGLEGAIFSVYAREDVYTLDGTLRYKKGEKVDTITTNADGIATTKALYLGKYMICEEETPYGMILNGEPVYAELTYAGEEISVTSTAVSISNERQKVTLDLLKTMEQDETFKLGTNDEINEVQFGLYAAEALIAKDGKEIPKDGLLETVKCDVDGKAVFTTDVPVGAKLYVKEIATDSRYILSDTVYYVEFIYAGQDVETVVISINDGNAIANKIIRGNIEGLKLDEDGNVVEGAVFGLFYTDTTEFTEETAILTSITNNEGRFGFENVPVGKWLIKELSCPEQFVLSDEIFTAEITEDGQIIIFEAENKFITGSVKIIKKDADSSELLSGVEFGLFDVEGVEIVRGVTDKNGELTFDSLRFGKYELRELTPKDGYYRVENVFDVEISEHGQTVTFEIDNKKIPEKPDVPDTGYDSDVGLWISVLIIALLSLIGMIGWNRKTRRN